MLIEIQVRTKLQHLWATAVETMGLFTQEALKASQGDTSVLRFFALISSVFAFEEKTKHVCGTPDSIEETIGEIQRINKEHRVIDMLQAIIVATANYDRKESEKLKKGYYILIFNYGNRTLRMRYYKTAQIDEAIIEYNSIESSSGTGNIDAVLVSTDSFVSLKAAYPNYFSDIREFTSKVESYIKKK